MDFLDKANKKIILPFGKKLITPLSILNICNERKLIFWSIKHVGFNCHTWCALVRTLKTDVQQAAFLFNAHTGSLSSVAKNSSSLNFLAKDVLTCPRKKTKVSNFGRKSCKLKNCSDLRWKSWRKTHWRNSTLLSGFFSWSSSYSLSTTRWSRRWVLTFN